MNVIAPMAGLGIYRIAQAARLAEVPPQKARAWVLGYRLRERTEQGQTRSPPRLPSQVPQTGPEPVVSFADLIEMRFVHHYRLAGVRWSYITTALPRLREVFRESPEGDVVFHSDGVSVFSDALAESGDRHALDLVKGNYVMASVLRRTFKEELRLDAQGVVREWRPRDKFPLVIVDPHRAFGQPIVAPGIPTSVLADEFGFRHGNVSKVAIRYEVTPEAVVEAVGFEQSLKAAA